MNPKDIQTVILYFKKLQKWLLRLCTKNVRNTFKASDLIFGMYITHSDPNLSCKFHPNRIINAEVI